MSNEVAIYPSVDNGIEPGSSTFGGGTLVCKCATRPGSGLRRNQTKKTTAIIASAMLAAMSICGSAHAGSVTQPGETVGAALGAPLPVGVYGVDTGSIGQRGNTSEGVNIPVLLWSTPLAVGGVRFEVIAAAPELYVGNHSAKSFSAGMYVPFLGGILAYDFGNGLGISYLAGGYLGINGGDFGNAFDYNTFRQDIHVTYGVAGWNANANLIYGITGKNQATHASNPDYFNYDLSLTKTLGKWEIGPVAFGSTDVSAPKGTKAQSQFAIGGLVGYNFGPVVVQTYLTRDVAQNNYGQSDTRAWLRLVVPF